MLKTPSRWQRVKWWIADTRCEFTAKFGPWFLMRKDHHFCAVFRWRKLFGIDDYPPERHGWTVISNFWTQRGAIKHIDTELFWDGLVERIGPDGMKRISQRLQSERSGVNQ